MLYVVGILSIYWSLAEFSKQKYLPYLKLEIQGIEVEKYENHFQELSFNRFDICQLIQKRLHIKKNLVQGRLNVSLQL